MDQQYLDQLSRYQFQMGPSRGRLATALDILTDALALAGQHGVYCHGPGGKSPARDIHLISTRIQDSKDLILETMEELKSGSTDG